MFYVGDLQSGIALALAESKLVACFVRSELLQRSLTFSKADGSPLSINQDESEESSLWENRFLVDDEVASALTEKAIVLRMTSGSNEAGYLSAYFPVPTVPTLLLLHNGRVLLCLSAGLDQKQFTEAILRTFKNMNASDEGTEFLTNPQGGGSSMNPNSTAAGADDPTSSQATLVPQNTDPSTEEPRNSSPTSPSAPRPTSTVQNLLAERRERLERDKKDKDAAEKAEKKAKADARLDAITKNPDSAKAKQPSYAQEQRRRQQDAKQERQRVLREIQNDKAVRKEKEQQRKALAKAEAEGNDGVDGLANQQLAQEAAQSRPQTSKECAVQVRLFDGSTIRQRFPSDQTLRSHVRAWIEKQRSDGDTPYTFKQILSPMPNRTLSMSEEEESLQSLGLAPSATLVMVPVQGYTAAYAGESGLLSKGVSTGYNVLSTGAGIITGALSTFLGVGQANSETQQAASSGSSQDAQQTTSAASKINVRTLQDQRSDKEDHQLYNGNQLNFEPRRDDEGKED